MSSIIELTQDLLESDSLGLLEKRELLWKRQITDNQGVSDEEALRILKEFDQKVRKALETSIPVFPDGVTLKKYLILIPEVDFSEEWDVLQDYLCFPGTVGKWKYLEYPEIPWVSYGETFTSVTEDVQESGFLSLKDLQRIKGVKIRVEAIWEG